MRWQEHPVYGWCWRRRAPPRRVVGSQARAPWNLCRILLRTTARLPPAMPKRTDIDSILIVGSGPIVIGQACEFDYSGTQACRVLRREGYRVILVNSNPATIMTDPEFSDATYVEPLVPEIVEKIIQKERPDSILPTVVV